MFKEYKDFIKENKRSIRTYELFILLVTIIPLIITIVMLTQTFMLLYYDNLVRNLLYITLSIYISLIEFVPKYMILKENSNLKYIKYLIITVIIIITLVMLIGNLLISNLIDTII